MPRTPYIIEWGVIKQSVMPDNIKFGNIFKVFLETLFNNFDHSVFIYEHGDFEIMAAILWHNINTDLVNWDNKLERSTKSLDYIIVELARCGSIFTDKGCDKGYGRYKKFLKGFLSEYTINSNRLSDLSAVFLKRNLSLICFLIDIVDQCKLSQYSDKNEYISLKSMLDGFFSCL